MTEVGMVQINADKISKLTGFQAEEIAIIKNTVAKNTTDTELAYFLNVAKSVELSPFNKEIWCYKDNKGNVLVFTSRDGFLKKAQQSPLWNGMSSSEVCANDFFTMDIPSGKVEHQPEFKDRGAIIGAYAIVKPKGCEYPTVEWADITVYDKKQFVWNSHKAEMIKKVAEIHALKKAFGITILQSDMDWEVKNETAIPISTTMLTEGEIAEKENLEAMEKIIAGLAKYVGADKEQIKKDCIAHQKAKTFTTAYAQEIAKKIGLEL